jgi:hypothetical protein
MQTIVDWLGGLPIQGTTAIVATLAALLTTVACVTVRSRPWRWTFALAGPFVIASCIYWLPVWMGAGASEYAAWAGVFIGLWGLAGAAVSTVIVYAFNRR